MSSSHEKELPGSLPPIHPSRTISQLARIEVEEPPRKMRLMFGEGQVVFLRADGLRSRMIRTSMKSSRRENSGEINRQEVRQPIDSRTLSEVIEDVASGKNLHECPYSLTNPLLAPGDLCEASTDASKTSEKLSFITPTTQPNSEVGETSSITRHHSSGNRSYHPPSEFHGTSTMSTHKRRWNYHTSCLINADEQKDDNQIGYAPDPFLPMPRGRQNEISTALRMNYAAQRVENRKFRGQAHVYQNVKNTPDRDSITCEKCKMKYFSKSKNIQERISYLPSVNEEALPSVVFDCPVCKEATNAVF